MGPLRVFSPPLTSHTSEIKAFAGTDFCTKLCFVGMTFASVTQYLKKILSEVCNGEDKGLDRLMTREFIN